VTPLLPLMCWDYKFVPAQQAKELVLWKDKIDNPLARLTQNKQKSETLQPILQKYKGSSWTIMKIIW
jgi:hypothetical protein